VRDARSIRSLAGLIIVSNVAAICGCVDEGVLPGHSSALILGQPTCGDWILEYPTEDCEDGNQAGGDGCGPDCRTEPGWNCLAGAGVTGWGDSYFGASASFEGSCVAISAGAHHNVCLRPDGSTVGWGRNIDGQAEPQMGPFIAIDTGLHHSIGLRPNGSVVGWGSNISGQVEPNEGPFVAISCGREFNLGLRPDGSVVGWGDNDQGEANYHQGPFVAIAAGGYHSLGLRPDGSVEGWGENQWGEADSKPGPYIAISAGDHHSLGLKADGSVDAWGDVRYNQGRPNAGPFVAIDAGGFHNLGVRTNGSVQGWGFNYYGETVLQRGPFMALAAGAFHSIAMNRGTCVTVCGDSRIIGAETCDDGNESSADGCSSLCAIEPNWVCPAPGRPCVCEGIFTGPSCDECPEGWWGFPECAPCDCDDGDLCNGVEYCDATTGCRPGEPLVCDDDRECSVDSCDPAAGCWFDISDCECSDDSECNDGDACNGVGRCRKGKGECENGEPPVCDDDDVCNGTGYCDPSAGCIFVDAPDCEDGRLCTVDWCDPSSGCIHDDSECECAVNADCDDYSFCTGTETCDFQSGTCLAGQPVFCRDDRECTVDYCDPVTGCVFDGAACECESDVQCNDLSVCTGLETCLYSEGTCVEGQALVCNDNRSCSVDSCDVRIGCVSDISTCACNLDIDCDDGSVCTGVESCDFDSGTCVIGAPLNCLDGRPCTIDTCEPLTGCTHDASGCVCESDDQCRQPWELCQVEQNRCSAIQCESCAEEIDCGLPGNRCRMFESGSYCLLDCSESPDICRVGYTCTELDGDMLCVPDAGDCLCLPDVGRQCRGALVWWFDSCGQPTRVDEDCAERGCFDAACCPVGMSASVGGCVTVSVEPVERSTESDLGLSDILQSDDGIATDGGSIGPEYFGGCDFGNNAGGVVPLLLLAVLAAGFMIFRRRNAA